MIASSYLRTKRRAISPLRPTPISLQIQFNYVILNSETPPPQFHLEITFSQNHLSHHHSPSLPINLRTFDRRTRLVESRFNTNLFIILLPCTSPHLQRTLDLGRSGSLDSVLIRLFQTSYLFKLHSEPIWPKSLAFRPRDLCAQRLAVGKLALAEQLAVCCSEISSPLRPQLTPLRPFRPE